MLMTIKTKYQNQMGKT